MPDIKKIIMGGDGGVGRTTLLVRYTRDYFFIGTKITKGVEFFSKDLLIDEKDLRLSIWDFAGEERWRSIIDCFIEGVDGGILTFDLTRYISFENLEKWVKLFRKFDPTLPILLVGMKSDLSDEIMVDDDEVWRLKEICDMFDYVKVSSKTGENVELIFELLIKKILYREENEYERITHPELTEELPSQREELLSPPEIPIEVFHDDYIKPEFQINEYLTLKLENERINIYVLNELFLNCKYLLLINPHLNENQGLIDSIDEASELLSHETEAHVSPRDLGITIEQEFWGHCSNIQAWVENDYDTRILHRNLAFPLLKKLADMGDPLAKKIFKDEIGKRFLSGHLSTITYLLEENYLDYLNREEITSLLTELAPSSCLNKPRNRNLVFPLLKKLADMEDPLAKKVFKDEIGKKFLSGHLSTITYLIEESYLDNLNREEIESLLKELVSSSLNKSRDRNFWEILGLIYIKMEKNYPTMGDIIVNIVKEIEENEENTYYQIWYSVCLIYKKMKNYDKAIEYCEKLIKLNLNLIFVFFEMGTIYRLKEDFDKAIYFFNKVIDLNPDSALIWEEMGDFFQFDRNEFMKANKCYKKAFEFDLEKD